MIWFGLVLWYINHCRLLNAKSSLYNTYKIHMICKDISLITFLHEPKLILLHTIKQFQTLLCITNNSIKHLLFVYPQLNDRRHLFAFTLKVNQFN